MENFFRRQKGDCSFINTNGHQEGELHISSGKRHRRASRRSFRLITFLQTFAQPDVQFVYQTVQSPAQAAKNSAYNNTSFIVSLSLVFVTWTLLLQFLIFNFVREENSESRRWSQDIATDINIQAFNAKKKVSWITCRFLLLYNFLLSSSMPSTTVTSQSHNYSHQSTSSAVSSPSPSYKKSDKKRNEKPGKGLRHFSMRVCQKVKEKGVTSYNEVADELVAEESDDAGGLNGSGSYDQKNIRRRVYDALNVLMAMNIISKEKKEIKWIGLPTSSAQECEEIELQNTQTRKRIEEKQQQLRELVLKVRMEIF